jgi:hypothetical protein
MEKIISEEEMHSVYRVFLFQILQQRLKELRKGLATHK